jgi:hypothetical protein
MNHWGTLFRSFPLFPNKNNKNGNGGQKMCCKGMSEVGGGLISDPLSSKQGQFGQNSVFVFSKKSGKGQST